MHIKKFLLGVVTCLFALCLVPFANADGTETLGEPSIAIETGSGFVLAGVGTESKITSFQLDVPIGVDIKQVLLYWSGATREGTPGDDVITVNDTNITGTKIGVGPGQKYYESYRADITNLGLVTIGTNSINIGNMDFIAENDGAGIIVIYDDGQTKSDIHMADGLDIAYLNRPEPGQTTIPQTFSFAPEDIARTANIGFLVGSVLKERPNVIRITTGGATVDHFNLLSSAQGSQWDALAIPVTIPAGATDLTVEIQSESDGTDRLPASLTWVNVTLAIPITPVTSCANFADMAPGSSVEGLGTVHPDLNISTSGHAISLVERSLPFAYVAPNNAPAWNGGLGEYGGFYDRDLVHDYTFTFASDASIDYFSMRLLDYGDYNPLQASKHEITLVGYDLNGNIIDSDKLLYMSDPQTRPRAGSAGDLWLTGDAKDGFPGEPGNYTFAVASPNLSRVELLFSNDVNPDKVSDPKFAIGDLCFGAAPPPPVCVDFAALPPGSPVEGLGTVHPNLALTTSGGSTVSLIEGLRPFGYVATNNSPVWNGGLGEKGGFYDSTFVHDYVVTFDPGTTANYFSMNILDYGDFNPLLATAHEIKLTGFDADGNPVAQNQITYTSEKRIRPHAGSMGDLWFSGDALTAKEGEVGNHLFRLSEPGMARVELTFSNDIDPAHVSDPKFAIGSLCFNPVTP